MQSRKPEPPAKEAREDRTTDGEQQDQVVIMTPEDQQTSEEPTAPENKSDSNVFAKNS